jgi:signal transduction histidine kinase
MRTVLGSCTAIDVDYLVSKRDEPQSFRLLVDANKIRDDNGNHLTDFVVTFDARFDDTDAGHMAEQAVPWAVQQSHDRLCTVTRTIKLEPKWRSGIFLQADSWWTSWLSAAARDVTTEKWAQERLRDLAGQLMTAQERERRRIAMELHDDVTQRLAALGIDLGLLKRTPTGPSALELHGELSRLQAQIIGLSEDVRTLSHSLHPSILEHSDLATSLEMHCHEFTDQHGIAASFTTRDVPDDIPRSVAVALYRIAQESLRNVVRHSDATAASVALAGEGGTRLSLFVIDNGKGFDVGKAKASLLLGLLSIEERARHIGASVKVSLIKE